VSFVGETAALGTAVCWSVTSLFFAAAGRRIGSFVVNQVRIPLAVVFLSLALLATTGSPWPSWMSSTSAGFLCLSGVIGLVLGDSCYFESLVVLGPRRATLLMSLTPAATALLAWPLLDEGLGFYSVLGIAVTLAGVFWVVLERVGENQQVSGKSVLVGVLAGVGGALGQAAGLVLAKMGMAGGVDALSATAVRMDAAVLGVWLLGAFRGTSRQAVQAFRPDRTFAAMAGGAFFGPFLGVWLSLFAVKHTEAAIAATLMATVPVVVIPLVVILQHERPSPRAVLGAVVAVAGVAMLFLR